MKNQKCPRCGGESIEFEGEIFCSNCLDFFKAQQVFIARNWLIAAFSAIAAVGLVELAAMWFL